MTKTQNRIYLDYNAGTPLHPAVSMAVCAVMEEFGNPSSVHAEGRGMRKYIEIARRQLAEYIQCPPGNVIFTASATEAANQALSPVVRVSGREKLVSRLYVSAVEHPCILSGGRFSSDDIEIIPVLESGIVDLARLEEMLARHDSATGVPMVAVMLANNETGIIQPIDDVREIVRRHDGFLVVDAVQGLGKIETSMDELGADFVLFSAHKVGGPQGAGALVLGSESIVPAPLHRGGGQESFNRAGTENTAAITGFGVAIEHLSHTETNKNISAIRDSIEDGLRTISSVKGEHTGKPVFFGQNADRLPNTTCFAVPGIKAETALISLDLAGIAASSGSACSSGKVRKSHVLAAMGISDDLANGALRISLGPESRMEDAARFLDAWEDIVRICNREEIPIAV